MQNLACFIFCYHQFWASPFCLNGNGITLPQMKWHNLHAILTPLTAYKLLYPFPFLYQEVNIVNLAATRRSHLLWTLQVQRAVTTNKGGYYLLRLKVTSRDNLEYFQREKKLINLFRSNSSFNPFLANVHFIPSENIDLKWVNSMLSSTLQKMRRILASIKIKWNMGTKWLILSPGP